MVRDFDYVTIEDYKKDMKESSDRASFIIQKKVQEVTELKRVIYALVASNGGQLILGDEFLSIREPHFTTEYHPAKRQYIIKL